MYVAIVFLPLLGAVIAGAIALIGARNRLPGADPPPPDDDHATLHADESHAAPSLHGAHDEEATEPAAAGSRATELITSTLLVITCVLSWYAFFDVGFGGHDARVPMFSFITFADLKADWALRIDSLTAVMLVVVTTISSLVHIYSIGYMEDDPYRPRFFAYLS